MHGPRKNRVRRRLPSLAARASGKVILYGEHAVVFGEPALGLALSREVRVLAKPGTGKVRIDVARGIEVRESPNAATPGSLVARALGPLAERLDLRIHLGFPPMSGFGSSAALAVALLELRGRIEGVRTRAAMLEAAIEVERAAHARPSGVDPAICLTGGLVLFRRRDSRPEVRRIAVRAPFFLVVGAAGAHGGTAQTVSRMASLGKTAPALARAAMRTLGETSTFGARTLARGDLAGAGRAMTLAHGVLSGLGLVSRQVQEVVWAAERAGALGAKMSGAGGAGGAFVALCGDRASAARVIDALSEKATCAWIERVR